MTNYDHRWLTSTVCGLLDAIRDERDVSRLPILADALMDAGCGDEELIGYLQRQNKSWLEYLDWYEAHFKARTGQKPESDHILDWMAQWAKPEAQDALERINGICERIGEEVDEDLPMTFSTIMKAASGFINKGEETGLDLGLYNRLYVEGLEPMFEPNGDFWRSYELLADAKVEEIKQGQIFCCSC